MSPGGDHRRNIRPYVLFICFFWGVVLGFLAYTHSETAAELLEIAEVKEKQENKRLELERKETENLDIAQVDSFKKTEEIEEPPEIAAPLAKPEVSLVEEKIIEPDFRTPPVIANLGVEDLPGLSGQTVSLPVKPIPPVVNTIERGEIPSITGRKPSANPFAEENVVLDDIAPPELDD